MRPGSLNRLHSLDTMRGLAALAVVFWHWQHFFAISGTFQHGWKFDMEPLFWLFKPLYLHGWAAVDLFFPLSGFIFYWLYAGAIRARSIGFAEFARLRLSRLYPLHTAMLFAAAALQAAFHARTGHWFIYVNNDWQHFGSSLLMAQQWLPPTLAQCFDGPAWSVSVEILLYGVFFLVVRFGFGGWRPALLIALVSIPLIFWNEFIARGLMGFFVGGAIYHLGETIKAHANARQIAQILGLVVIALWALVLCEVYVAPLHSLIRLLAGASDKSPLYDIFVGWFFRLLFTFVVSPLTILALSLDEKILGGRYGRISVLGDISYSTYLLHIPLQIVLALAALSLGLKPHDFMSFPVLVAFLAALIGLGYLSFRFFERPMQRWIRGRAVPRLAPAHSLS